MFYWDKIGNRFSLCFQAHLTEPTYLKALESIFILVCYLVHQHDILFLLQFCDAVIVVSVYKLINFLRLPSPKQESRIGNSGALNVQYNFFFRTRIMAQSVPDKKSYIDLYHIPSCNRAISSIKAHCHVRTLLICLEDRLLIRRNYSATYVKRAILIHLQHTPRSG